MPPPDLLWEGKIQPHYPGISELEASQRTPDPMVLKAAWRRHHLQRFTQIHWVWRSGRTLASVKRYVLCQAPCIKNHQPNSNPLLHRKGNSDQVSFYHLSRVSQTLVAKNLAVLTRCPMFSLSFNSSSRRADFTWKGIMLEILWLKCFQNIGKCSFLKINSVLRSVFI